MEKLVQECSKLEGSYLDDGYEPSQDIYDLGEAFLARNDDKLKNTVSSSHGVKEGEEDKKNRQGNV